MRELDANVGPPIEGKLHAVFTQTEYLTGIPADYQNPTTIRILQQIAAAQVKKIPFSDFMDISNHVYYADGGVRFGEGEDFETSPVISEIFGATIGNGTMKVWE